MSTDLDDADLHRIIQRCTLRQLTQLRQRALNELDDRRARADMAIEQASLYQQQVKAAQVAAHTGGQLP